MSNLYPAIIRTPILQEHPMYFFTPFLLFQTLDICHLNHESDQVVAFHGRWEVGLNAGGVQKGDFRNFAKNPQCFIRLADPDPSDPEGKCSAIISLMQRREPKSRAKGMNKVRPGIY